MYAVIRQKQKFKIAEEAETQKQADMHECEDLDKTNKVPFHPINEHLL